MGHGFVFNPVASSSLQAGDEVIVLGQEDQIARLRAYVAPS
jgi:K+/H+ antiporter YhaU regulatory subunit KhtT